MSCLPNISQLKALRFHVSRQQGMLSRFQIQQKFATSGRQLALWDQTLQFSGEAHGSGVEGSALLLKWYVTLGDKIILKNLNILRRVK